MNSYDDSFARCKPTHDKSHFVIVDMDGAMLDDATTRDVIEFLRSDGQPLLMDSERSLGVFDGTIGSLATIEWHDNCDPDECPLGACGSITHDIDVWEDEIRIACDAAKEGRYHAALEILRASL